MEITALTIMLLHCANRPMLRSGSFWIEAQVNGQLPQFAASDKGLDVVKLMCRVESGRLENFDAIHWVLLTALIGSTAKSIEARRSLTTRTKHSQKIPKLSLV